MIRANSRFAKPKSSRFFHEIAVRVKAFQERCPEVDFIRPGIGDAAQPPPAPYLEALHRTVEEMGHASTFRGYGPSEGFKGDIVVEAMTLIRQRIPSSKSYSSGEQPQ